MSLRHRTLTVGERRRAALERFKLLLQISQSGVVEPRSYFPGVKEPARVIVIAHEQSAQARTGAARIRITTDHVLAGLDAFHFQPIVSAPRSIKAIATLANDTLQMQRTTLLEKGGRIAFD